MYTTVSARLDARLKEEAESVLSSLGISHSAAIAALYSQIVLQQGLPFDLKLPPKSTRFGLSYWELRDAVRTAAARCEVAKVWLHLRTKSQKQRPVCLDVASYQELLAQEVRTRYAFSLTSRFISVILRAGAKGRRERGCSIEEAQTSLPSGIAGYGHHRGAAAGEHRPQLLSSAKAG